MRRISSPRGLALILAATCLCAPLAAQDRLVDVDVPVAQYQARFNQRVADGYAPIAVTASDTGSRTSALFQIIWERGRTGWAARHDQTAAQYQTFASQQFQAGREPWFVDSYGTFPDERYVTTWGPASGDLRQARHRMTSAQFQAEFVAQANAGNIPTWVGASGSGADARLSALWFVRRGQGFGGAHDRSRGNFVNFVSGNAPGLRVINTCSYGAPGAERFAGILHSAGSITHESRLGMTRTEFDQTHHQFVQQGYVIQSIDAHGTGASRLYDASWDRRAGPDVFTRTGPTDASLTSFDATIEAHMRARGITRGALAVMRDGRLVHSRGYTLAPAGTPATKPNAMFRIASLSKPVTSVGIMKLVQEGSLRLSDRIVPLLGLTGIRDSRWNLITVDHLLTHTAGFDRAISGDPMFRDAAIAATLGLSLPISSDDVVRYMAQTRPLDFSPGARYAYSNFGYCLLGRVVEAVTGRDYEDWMIDEVLTPLGCGSMRIGDSPLGQQIANEVNYVDPSGNTASSVMGPTTPATVPTPYGAFNIRNMDAHGGWVASAADLARFVSQIDRTRPNPVLAQSFVSSLWSRPPVWSPSAAAWYARGWSVRPITGPTGTNMWHHGSLNGTYTVMVKRFDGIDYAVVFNQRSTAGLPPSSDIDPQLYGTASAIASWPGGDLKSTAGNLTTSGTACGGVTGDPWIRLGGGTQPVLGQSFEIEVENLPATSAPVLFYSLQNQAWLGQPLPIPLDGLGAPGCSIYLPPVEFVPVPNSGGRIDMTVPVTDDPSLVGFEYFIQVLVPDPTANAAGAAISNLARIQLGSH